MQLDFRVRAEKCRGDNVLTLPLEVRRLKVLVAAERDAAAIGRSGEQRSLDHERGGQQLEASWHSGKLSQSFNSPDAHAPDE